MLLLRRCLILAVVAGLLTGSAAPATPGEPLGLASAALPDPALVLAGREEDYRVARLAFRLATAGRARCTMTVPLTALVLQHLSQFDRADRPTVLAALPLDRGPGVIAVVQDGPAARAGIRVGDILLSVDGVDLPPETGLAEPFDAARARARADAVYDLLAVGNPVSLVVLRDGARVTARLTPVPGCPSRVHLARSNQRNAFADGQYVYLSTGILSVLTSDDELAFIVAHEMAHNILGHATLLRGSTVKKGLGRTLGRSGVIIRGTETEADVLGSEIMLDAGFDPVRGAAILTRLGGSDLGIALFAKHEPVGKRMAKIRAVAAGRSTP